MDDDPRFWTLDDPPSLAHQHGGLPFGADTVGLVDEEAGGIVAYCHRENAGWLLDRLRAGTP